MARATCRCGQALDVPPPGVDHVQCPRCGARVRLVRKRNGAGAGAGAGASAGAGADPDGLGDGFIRFSCPCGRRLKVNAFDPPTHGKCPDCDRIVPVPFDARASSPAIESPTEDLDASDVAMLEAWTRSHQARTNGPGTATNPQPGRAEAGLRICPRCGKPIHINADTCRVCGIPVPKR